MEKSFIKKGHFIHNFLTGNGFIYYKGSEFLEAGFMYVAYIPVMNASNDFQPRRGIMSRYATRVVNNNFYGTISISDT